VLQRLAEWFLGIPPADPGQGTEWHFSHAFPWPSWVLLLFCLAAGAGVVWVYRQDAALLPRRIRWLLTGLRLAVIGLLLVVLSEVVLSIERTGLPYAVVLLDVSASMATEDQYSDSAARNEARRLVAEADTGGPSRLNLGKALLLERNGAFLKSLLENHKLRLYTVAAAESLLGNGDSLRAADIDGLLPEIRKLQPLGDQTRLGDALRRVLNGLRGTPPSAVIVITDGITTDGETLSAAAHYARQKSVPVFTVGIGNPDPTRDLELHDVLVDDVAFVDDPVTFTSKLTAHGYAGEQARLVLRLKDSSEELASRTVTVPGDGQNVKLELTYTPRIVGDLEFVLEVVPLPKESNVRNNSEVRRISIRKEKIRVLLVDALPRWEFRELKVLLEREKTVELKAVLQDSDPEFAEEDLSALSHFPVKKEDLFHYDVVILGDVNLAYLSSSVLDNLREFVREKGGGLIFIAGPSHNPLSYEGTVLETLLPIELSGARIPDPLITLTESFHPELTVEGRKGSSVFRFADTEQASDQIWQSLPGFFWFVEVMDLKPGALVFATHPLRMGHHDKMPIIALQRFGAGKVLFHATDETWRWRFRTGDLYYGRYWVQAIRYLSRSKLLGKDRGAELTVDRKVYQTGDSVQMHVRFLDEQLAPTTSDGVSVMVERAGDVTRTLALSRIPEAPMVFEGHLSNIAEGNYHAWVATPAFSDAPPSQDFRVEAPSRETRQLRMDLSELAQTATITRGKSYTLGNAEQVVRDIPPGLPVPLDTDEPLRLWNHWLVLTLLTGLLCLEWVLRKRYRLI